MYQSSSFSALKTKKLILQKSNFTFQIGKNRFNLPDNSDLGKKTPKKFSKRGSFNPRLVRGPFYSFLGGLFVAIKYYYCESPTSLAFLNLIFVELFYFSL